MRRQTGARAVALWRRIGGLWFIQNSNRTNSKRNDACRFRRDRAAPSIRLITRRGNDWSDRFPLVIEAVNHLKVRSCLIDGEVVCCDAQGVTFFQLLRHRRNEPRAFLLRLRPAGVGRHGPSAGTDRSAQGDLASILRRGLAAFIPSRPC